MINSKRIMESFEYWQKPTEQERINNLISIIPKGYSTVLDVGA